MTTKKRCSDDEEAMFEAWYPLVEARVWEDMYGLTSPPPGWKEELKIAMREGWMARASLHVTYSQSAKT
jgi:hypothetical protein